MSAVVFHISINLSVSSAIDSQMAGYKRIRDDGQVSREAYEAQEDEVQQPVGTAAAFSANFVVNRNQMTRFSKSVIFLYHRAYLQRQLRKLCRIEEWYLRKSSAKKLNSFDTLAL